MKWDGVGRGRRIVSKNIEGERREVGCCAVVVAGTAGSV